MIKYFVILGVILSAAFATPMEELNLLSKNIFQARKNLYGNPNKPLEKDKLQEQAQKGIDILSGKTYTLSKEKQATSADYLNVLKFLYHINTEGLSFTPAPSKAYEVHEAKHFAVIEIMQRGIQELLNDYTLGVHRENLFKHLQDRKDKISSYGQAYMTTEILKIIFPEDFFFHLSQLGCSKDKKSAYKFALAVRGKDYTIDKDHFFYKGRVTQVSYSRVGKEAVMCTSQKAEYGDTIVSKGYYYKKFNPQEPYDQTFLNKTQGLYQQVSPLSTEETLALLLLRFNKPDEIDFMYEIDAVTKKIIPLNLKVNLPAKLPMQNYLENLFAQGVDLTLLKSCVEGLKVKKPSSLLKKILELIEKNLKAAKTSFNSYSDFKSIEADWMGFIPGDNASFQTGPKSSVTITINGKTYGGKNHWGSVLKPGDFGEDGHLF